MTIQFYEYPASPYCRSVRLIANILKVPLETKIVNLHEQEQLKPEYLQKTPFRQVPAINDDGLCFSESRAIACYLVDKYAPNHSLYPKDVRERAIINQMLYFDSGTLEPSMVGLTRPLRSNIIPGPESHDKAKDAIKSLDTILSERKYVAGDTLSIADITIRATLTHNEVFGNVDLSEHKNVLAWSQKVREDTNPDYGEINDQYIVEWKEEMNNLLAKVKKLKK